VAVTFKQFERARDVYEEGINTVITVRDFTMVFDAYSQFEESVLTAKMNMAQDSDEDDDNSNDSDDDDDEVYTVICITTYAISYTSVVH
jgi:pre-mRNA-splicing factor SYF1